jgi:hypothetical protein
MIERDPKAIAKHCREAVGRSDLPEHHREMLAGYARFYQALAEQVAREAGRRSAAKTKALGSRGLDAKSPNQVDSSH